MIAERVVFTTHKSENSHDIDVSKIVHNSQIPAKAWLNTPRCPYLMHVRSFDIGHSCLTLQNRGIFLPVNRRVMAWFSGAFQTYVRSPNRALPGWLLFRVPHLVFGKHRDNGQFLLSQQSATLLRVSHTVVPFSCGERRCVEKCWLP